MNDLSAPADGSTCRNCGNEVTDQFARVFGDNDDVVHRCPECDSYRGMCDGRSANVETSVPDPEEVGGHHGNEARADGGRRRDRGQSNVAVLIYALVTTLLFSIPLIMVVSAA